MKSLLPLLLILTFSANAQKIKLINGSLQGLKSETSYDMLFTYDSMIIGMAIPEQTYLDDLKKRWNEREPSKGDSFVTKWFNARKELYEPAFKKNFEKYSGLKLNDINAKYTLVLKTRHIEGGWDIGIEGQPGIIAGELWIVESANKNIVKAKIDLYDSKGNDFNGGDFEMTRRIKSAYGSAGRWMGTFILRKSK